MYHAHYSSSHYYPSWKQVLKWIKETKNPFVLDIGCGPGQFAHMLFDNKVYNYTGIDFSGEAISRARVLNPEQKEKFLRADALECPLLENNKFTHYVFLEILEHIYDDLKLIERVPMEKNIVLSVPNFDTEGHVRYFDTMREVRERYCGYIEIESTATFGPEDSSSKWFLLKGKRIKNTAR
jgi:ubiquinone/menaquinone biosynthesis C-methylase UbiE